MEQFTFIEFPPIVLEYPNVADEVFSEIIHPFALNHGDVTHDTPAGVFAHGAKFIVVVVGERWVVVAEKPIVIA